MTSVPDDEYVYGTAILGPSGREAVDGEPVPFVDEFIVLPRAVAQSLARRWSALDVETWGDMRTTYPDVYAEVYELAGYSPVSDSRGRVENPPPEDDDPFDLTDVLFYVGSEWPPSPRRLMYECLPDGMAERLGTTYTNVVDGEVVEFAPDAGPTLINELQELGFRCVPDPELIGSIARSELQQWS